VGPPVNPVAARDAVRSIVARAVLGNQTVSPTLGAVTLLAHQREAAVRAHDAIARFGGALVADDVGAGKTFVALAVAQAYATPLVVAPAVLRDTWEHAGRRARVQCAFISVESLGRGRPPPRGHDLMIVDEAHHLRNPSTKRYRTLASGTNGAHLLLLSGTPVHNAVRDLDALLALFAGPDARDLTPGERAKAVVRTTGQPTQPDVIVHPAHRVPDAHRVVRAVQQLPTPVPVRDGGTAPTLFRCALLRAWCSSAAALDSMLRRASLAAAALADSLRAGRRPSRAELSAWSLGEDGQLAFAELVASEAVVTPDAVRQAEAFIDSVNRARELVRERTDCDDARARILLEMLDAHPRVAVLACTQYAATVDALWRRLRETAGVCALTARGARIASGPISRNDALARFAPRAQGRRPPHERERIRLLVTTDLVSEGLNLQDAGVIVHLDVPWTAARLAQRVGRVARVGSTHACVHVHSLAPPRAAAALLALERRVHRKRRVAELAVGGGRRNAALLGGTGAKHESASDARARIARALIPFAERAAAPPPAGHPRICAVDAPQPGWLAVVSNAGDLRLMGSLASRACTTSPEALAPMVAWLCEHPARELPAGWQRAVDAANRWAMRERASRLSHAHRRTAARVFGGAIARTVAAVRNAPHHERARLARSLSPLPPTPDPPTSVLAIAIFRSDDQDRGAI